MKMARKKSILLCAVLALVFWAAAICMSNTSASAEESLDFQGVTLEMKSGASVKINDTTAADRNGIRFAVQFSEEEKSIMDGFDSVSYGIVVAPADYLIEGKEFTEENLFGANAIYGWAERQSDGSYGEYTGDKVQIINMYDLPPVYSEEDGAYMVYGSVVNILDVNLARSYVGLGYAKCEKDGVTDYLMADYAGHDISNNTRSIYQVSVSYINDATIVGQEEEKAWAQTNYVDKVQNAVVSFADEKGTAPEEVKAQIGSAIVLPQAEANEDFVFMGWNDGEKTYKAGGYYVVREDKTLTAVWATSVNQANFEEVLANAEVPVLNDYYVLTEDINVVLPMLNTWNSADVCLLESQSSAVSPRSYIGKIAGTLDGNGHSITVEYNIVSGTGWQSFISVISGTVKNVTFNISAKLGNQTGLFALSLFSTGEIENCTINGTVKDSGDASGSGTTSLFRRAGGTLRNTVINLDLTDCAYDDFHAITYDKNYMGSTETGTTPVCENVLVLSNRAGQKIFASKTSHTGVKTVIVSAAAETNGVAVTLSGSAAANVEWSHNGGENFVATIEGNTYKVVGQEEIIVDTQIIVQATLTVDGKVYTVNVPYMITGQVIEVTNANFETLFNKPVVRGSYKLTENIVLTSASLAEKEVLANGGHNLNEGTSTINPVAYIGEFMGVLDGSNGEDQFSITYSTTTTSQWCGFIGILSGTIKNVTINATASMNTQGAAFVSTLYSTGVIENCTLNIEVTSSGSDCATIRRLNGTVTNTTIDVTATQTSFYALSMEKSAGTPSLTNVIVNVDSADQNVVASYGNIPMDGVTVNIKEV